MKRKKIKFKDLLNIGGGYDLPTLLEVINWMLKKGKGYTNRSGWYGYGVDKQLFGYSANNHESASKIQPDLRLYFLNAILAEAPPIVEKWRAENGITLDGYFFISCHPSSNCTKQFHFINGLHKKGLKKAYYHPDYADRVNPYIKSIKICSVGAGIEIRYDFTFDCHPGGGWRGTDLRQTADESISDFFDRAVGYFEERLLLS